MVAELVNASMSRRFNLYSKVEGSNLGYSPFFFERVNSRTRIESRSPLDRDLATSPSDDVMRAQHDVMDAGWRHIQVDGRPTCRRVKQP